MSEESLLVFPCEFPIKVMGENTADFEAEVIVIANQHVSFKEGAVRTASSRTGKYLSVTMTFTAESREQLDDLYRAMNAHPAVKMVL